MTVGSRSGRLESMLTEAAIRRMALCLVLPAAGNFSDRCWIALARQEGAGHDGQDRCRVAAATGSEGTQLEDRDHHDERERCKQSDKRA